MARRRGGRSSGGARGRRGHDEQVAVPVAEEAGLEFAEPERPARGGGRRPSGGAAIGGPGIGVMIPLAVTAVAVILIAVAGFMAAGTGSKAVENALDGTAIAIAQAFSAVEPAWWDANHGTEKTIWEVLSEKKEEKLRKEKAKNFADRDEGEIYQIEENFKALVATWGLKAPDAADQSKNAAIRSANSERLKKIVGIEGTAILYAGIYTPNGDTAILRGGAVPDRMLIGNDRSVGKATIASAKLDGLPARIVEYPISDAFGEPEGRVKIAVVARGAKASATGTVVIFALVGLLLVGGISFVLCLGAAKGLSTLARELDQVARGDLDVKFRAGGGEIGAVARSADRAIKTMQKIQEDAVMSAAAVQPVAAPVEASVDTASLLPKEPPRVDGYEIEAVHKPSPAGHNDFFDYIQIDEKHIGVVIADLPRPGAEGAFAATTFRAVMRSCAIGDLSPASVLGKVNRTMSGELSRGDHISAMYTVLDTENGIVAVASAGHLPLIFWKLEKKGSALLNPEGIAIGLDKGPVFEKTVVDKRIKMERGDRFVLYTDGPVAAKNMNGEEFGEQRFYYTVSREAPKNSAAFVNFVANEVDLFHEGAIQEDDITLVTVRKL